MHQDYGLSTYETHTDGSGICHSSRLRPIHLHALRLARPIWTPAAPACATSPPDTHLYDWLEAKGYDYDIITDDHLHAEGVDLIAPYKTVMTTSHRNITPPRPGRA